MAYSGGPCATGRHVIRQTRLPRRLPPGPNAGETGFEDYSMPSAKSEEVAKSVKSPGALGAGFGDEFPPPGLAKAGAELAETPEADLGMGAGFGSGLEALAYLNACLRERAAPPV